MAVFSSGPGAPETPRFHPDGGWLCVETAPPRVGVTDGKVSGTCSPFANMLAQNWPGGFRGPDGMCFSDDGRLWCTVYGDDVATTISMSTGQELTTFSAVSPEAA